MKKHEYDQFNIYIDRIKDGKEEDLSATIDPSFMEITEQELCFPQPISVKGEAYLTDDHLIIHFGAKTSCQLPCKICNEIFSYPIDLPMNTYPVPLEEIKGAIFNYKDTLREALLLVVPLFAECHGGTCPMREEIKNYLRKEKSPNTPSEKTYHPFGDL